MKKYKVTYVCHITKSTLSTMVRGETEAKAKRKFKEGFYIPPTVLTIEEEK